MPRIHPVWALLIPLLACLAACHTVNHGAVLLSADQFDANRSYVERGTVQATRSLDALAPRILVETPDPGAGVTPPVDVVVRFEPAADAKIDVDSLQVKYGWFDITDTVIKSMAVSETGITGRLTVIRAGDYALKVSIADSKKRTGYAKLDFRVAAS